MAAFLRLSCRGIGFALLILASGCTGSETGNATVDEETVAMKLFGDGDVGLLAVDGSGAEFEITEALLAVDTLTFVLPAGASCPAAGTAGRGRASTCAGRNGQNEVSFEGPWLAELVSGQIWPSTADIELPLGAYASVEVRLHNARGGSSIALQGTMSVGGELRDFALSLPQTLFASFTAPEGLIQCGGDVPVALGFSMVGWFEGMTFGSCLGSGSIPEEGGVLRLEKARKTDCGDIAKAIRESLGRGRASAAR
jgi:hypothetical protein